MDAEDGKFYTKHGSFHVLDRTVYAAGSCSIKKMESSWKNKDRWILRIEPPIRKIEHPLPGIDSSMPKTALPN